MQRIRRQRPLAAYQTSLTAALPHLEPPHLGPRLFVYIYPRKQSRMTQALPRTSTSVKLLCSSNDATGVDRSILRCLMMMGSTSTPLSKNGTRRRARKKYGFPKNVLSKVLSNSHGSPRPTPWYPHQHQCFLRSQVFAQDDQFWPCESYDAPAIPSRDDGDAYL